MSDQAAGEELPKAADFQLLLFSKDPPLIRHAIASGIDAIVVDLERRGKEDRQLGADTQIGADTLDDLARVRSWTEASVICRIDAFGDWTQEQVEAVIRRGADEILLPMVRRPYEVERVLDQVKGRSSLGILVETVDAIDHAEALAVLPIARTYVGLNDLAIDRGRRSIFDALDDGTVERLSRIFRQPFGFGGLTLPDRGHPIPCHLLIGEMARVGATFGVLRRSFHRDIRGRDVSVEIPRLRRSISQAYRRPPELVEQDRLELHAAIARADTPM